MDIKQSLLQLGFHPNEAEVYLTLHKLGLSQAGPLVKSTKLHRMLVYNALDKLIDQGLVSVVRKKNIKLFQPCDPSSLIDNFQRLHLLAKAISPELRKLQQEKTSIVDVRTLVGMEGFRKNLEDVVLSASRSKKRYMHIIGGAKDTEFYEAVGDWYKNYTDLLEKYGVKKLLLSPAPYSEVFKKKFAHEKDTELRTLPHGLSSPTYTRITDEMVSIEIYKPQIIVIQIRNKAIASAYLDSFHLLWKNNV